MKNCCAVLIVLLALTGCNGCKKNKSREKPDVSDIKVDVHIERFDKDLFSYTGENYSQYQEAMRNKYGSFYDFYLQQFLREPQDTVYPESFALQSFLSDAYIRRIQDSINLHFKDTIGVEDELSQSLKYLKYYFPDIEVSKIIAVNSGFSVGAFTYQNDVLGIGLDLYLGANNPDYDSAGIYQYLHHKMRKEYIARNSLEVLYNFYFGGEENLQGKNLIEAITEKGKKIYFLSLVFPDAPDSLLVGFTQKQVEWCEKSEYEIWKYMNERDLLYKNDYMNQKRYLDDGPTTVGMPPEAPGAIGNWVGLQVVRKFVKETGNKIALQDLLTKYDGKTIFEKAKYRPSKSYF